MINKDFLNKVLSCIENNNIRMPLLLGFNEITIQDINILVSKLDKLCIVTDMFFLRREIQTKFSNNHKIEVMPYSMIKSYDYDAIISKDMNAFILSILNAKSSINIVLLENRFSGDTSFFTDFDFIDDNHTLFRKIIDYKFQSAFDNIQDYEVVEDDFKCSLEYVENKIGIGITTTSSRFDILRKQLEILYNITNDIKDYEFAYSVFCDEELSEDALNIFNELKTIFADVTFQNRSVKSIAIAKNNSMLPLVDAGCQYFISLDDDILIIDERAILYYIEACKDFHFLHVHLTNYCKNEEVLTKLIKDYGNFKVVSYGYDTGCMLVFDRAAIIEAGMWDPNFKGWGHEHREFGKRVEQLILNMSILP